MIGLKFEIKVKPVITSCKEPVPDFFLFFLTTNQNKIYIRQNAEATRTAELGFQLIPWIITFLALSMCPAT